MKRLNDIMLSIKLMFVLNVPMLFVGLAVRITSSGPVIHWSRRIGRLNKVIAKPKFRTMVIKSPDIATHLVDDPKKYLTPIGSFLRKSSLDELPQLWSVLKGDMSIVGPRPALFNQHDLIILRKESGVDKLKPGITGWAQVNGRDELSIFDKVALDVEYLKKQSIWFDMKILLMTLFKALKFNEVSH
jgi:O-antigen biosynthesis protein WbqP